MQTNRRSEHKESQWRLKGTVAPLAILLAAAGAVPAYAAISNSVTVSGTAPSGPPGGVTSSDSVNVDVVDYAPAITVAKNGNWQFAPGGDLNGDGNVDAGDIIRYFYVVTNTGNVTLSNVTVSDPHTNGVGAPPTVIIPTTVTTDNGSAPAGTLGDSTDAPPPPIDNDWDTLGPGDVITFYGDYVVQPGDITSPGSLDGDIDSDATVSASYNPGTGPIVVSDTDTESVPLDQTPSLTVDKQADDLTDVVAGQVITYTYIVTNTGPVPLTNVTLADTHKGVPGALVPVFQSFTTNTGSTNSGNTITLLQPGDVAEFTVQYTVTQADVDTLQ